MKPTCNLWRQHLGSCISSTLAWLPTFSSRKRTDNGSYSVARPSDRGVDEESHLTMIDKGVVYKPLADPRFSFPPRWWFVFIHLLHSPLLYPWWALSLYTSTIFTSSRGNVLHFSCSFFPGRHSFHSRSTSTTLWIQHRIRDGG